MKNRLFVFFLAALVLSSSCTFAEDNESSRPSFEPRFVKLERFKMFDKNDYYSYTIRDLKTGECYFWLWGGSGNGGPAIVETECP